MKDRPIPFSAPMIRAILSGQKTQTRRAMKPRDLEFFKQSASEILGLWDKRPLPYGKPGDRLWVKENWRAPLAFELTKPSDMPTSTPIYYAADFSGGLPHFSAGKLRPSMFMPRWASRISLEITGVRVEKLKDITEADCKAEGASGGNGSIPGYHYSATPREHYRHIWETINGKDSFDINPLVWVVEFKQIQPLASAESAHGATN